MKSTLKLFLLCCFLAAIATPSFAIQCYYIDNCIDFPGERYCKPILWCVPVKANLPTKLSLTAPAVAELAPSTPTPTMTLRTSLKLPAPPSAAAVSPLTPVLKADDEQTKCRCVCLPTPVGCQWEYLCG